MALAIALIEGIVILIIQVVWLNPGHFGASTGGQPSTTIGWFQLFQNNRLVGLLDDAVLDIAVAALLVPLFLALFAALRRANRAWMAVATSLALIGIATYLPTNTSFSLLFVSDQFAAATPIHRGLSYWQQVRRQSPQAGTVCSKAQGSSSWS